MPTQNQSSLGERKKVRASNSLYTEQLLCNGSQRLPCHVPKTATRKSHRAGSNNSASCLGNAQPDYTRATYG